MVMRREETAESCSSMSRSADKLDRGGWGGRSYIVLPQTKKLLAKGEQRYLSESRALPCLPHHDSLCMPDHCWQHAYTHTYTNIHRHTHTQMRSMVQYVSLQKIKKAIIQFAHAGNLTHLTLAFSLINATNDNKLCT